MPEDINLLVSTQAFEIQKKRRIVKTPTESLFNNIFDEKPSFSAHSNGQLNPLIVFSIEIALPSINIIYLLGRISYLYH